MPSSTSVKEIFDVLLKAFGPQHWWPGDTPFEVMVGAILTQNTNWSNVERAIAQLKQEGLLSVEAMRDVPLHRLAQAIRPAGYFNVKAGRLKNFIGFIVEKYEGDLRKMKRQPLDVLRRELLGVNGIGPETADSILLYALNKPIFVVDAYTRRFMRRHNLITERADYHDIQSVFMNVLPPDAGMFNEYHALIVRLGKEMCRPSARCEACPLNKFSYALDYKCCKCHRSLLRREKTFSVGGKALVCDPCRTARRAIMKRRPSVPEE